MIYYYYQYCPTTSLVRLKKIDRVVNIKKTDDNNNKKNGGVAVLREKNYYCFFYRYNYRIIIITEGE